MTKYGAKKTTVGDQTFDSKAEARRWQELVLLLKAGRIFGLRRQVPFVLAEGVKIDGEGRKRPPLRFVADFVYEDEEGRRIVEDVKGMPTPVYRLKKHLMRSVLGISVREA